MKNESENSQRIILQAHPNFTTGRIAISDKKNGVRTVMNVLFEFNAEEVYKK